MKCKNDAQLSSMAAQETIGKTPTLAQPAKPKVRVIRQSKEKRSRIFSCIHNHTPPAEIFSHTSSNAEFDG